MKLRFCILMILISYSYGQSLTSSESVVEKPGKSVTLSCSVSVISNLSDRAFTTFSVYGSELQQENETTFLYINDTYFIFIWTVTDLL
ncbi:hypothetical protein SRHO_G00190820 [Serrasalmus rhombeus]